MKKKFICIFVVSLVFCIGLPATVYAASYENKYPDYINYSGGAYIEVQSSIGRGAFVLPNTYKADYIGFYGSGNNICNLSNSTINCKYVASNGSIYNARFSSFSVPQYYYENGITKEWRNVHTTKIYNTNLTLIDETEHERGNNEFLDHDSFKYTVFVLFLFICITFFIMYLKVIKL